MYLLPLHVCLCVCMPVCVFGLVNDVILLGHFVLTQEITLDVVRKCLLGFVSFFFLIVRDETQSLKHVKQMV